MRALTRRPLALAGLGIVLLFVLAALAAPLLARQDPFHTDLAAVLSPPDAAHWLGTDELGRDVWARMLFGARLSLGEGLVSVAIAMAIGVPLGVLAGYAGGAVETVLMRLIDIMLAFPGVLLAIAVVSILGPSFINALLAVGLYAVPIFTRLARASTATVMQALYVEACRATGMGPARIMLRHVLPNIAPALLVVATLRVAVGILTASSLGFLGLGAQPPTPEWGAMLANSRDALLIAPHAVLAPGLAIMLLVGGLHLFQDGLAAVLDPKAQR